MGLDIDLCAIAKSVGYKDAFSASSAEELPAALAKAKGMHGPVLLEIKVKKGNRKDLGRPTTTPIQNKEALMEFLKD